MRLILYSKSGCHLCEGLQEKLQQVRGISFQLEVRDITTNDQWWQAYEYEIPVLVVDGEPPQRLPRLSPRGSVAQLEKMLQRFLPEI
ncbi:glutaredoxin family protein [Roseofilum casamattae]|uniref:Glutaredoxin family protein n=1 Tax=Roseofilum casamattae BLCC-M143 TaxID=3022442 RepID=A0ABT7BW44_9CYAN|nr:glutaredoxin family protein [Roseofilum casamattae BLCC-M143]